MVLVELQVGDAQRGGRGVVVTAYFAPLATMLVSAVDMIIGIGVLGILFVVFWTVPAATAAWAGSTWWWRLSCFSMSGCFPAY